MSKKKKHSKLSKDTLKKQDKIIKESLRNFHVTTTGFKGTYIVTALAVIDDSDILYKDGFNTFK